jgi:hypothetical protein
MSRTFSSIMKIHEIIVKYKNSNGKCKMFLVHFIESLIDLTKYVKLYIFTCCFMEQRLPADSLKCGYCRKNWEMFPGDSSRGTPLMRSTIVAAEFKNLKKLETSDRQIF